MFKIYIDTSDRKVKTVRLIKTGRSGEEVLMEKKGELDIVPSISQIISEGGLQLKDIDEFIAFPGPGSFTGLKMGITVINLFNWLTGKKKINELKMPNYGSEPNIHQNTTTSEK